MNEIGNTATVSLDRSKTPSASHSVNLSTGPSAWRAWLYLVWFSVTRQTRLRQMVWIALGLLALTATMVGLNTLRDGWSMGDRRWNWTPPPAKGRDGNVRPETLIVQPLRLTFSDAAKGMQTLPHAVPWPATATAIQTGIADICWAILGRTDFNIFSHFIVFSVFVGFLLPIWSLSFATEAISGEREGRSLIWLVTRPLPRSSIYLAKFVALLPWTLVLNLGGFGVLCLLAGRPGHVAFHLYWPAILGGTLAFSSLFHLMGACFRRAAVVGLVYSFFLETIVGGMPGYMKRLSIGFYTRCLMFDAGQNYGVAPEKPSIYLPVDSFAAWAVLLTLTAVFLVLGMIVFSKREYQDLT
jgi:ABC-type transport system involved in multi-copper enzyme maturation permease subunit